MSLYRVCEPEERINEIKASEEDIKLVKLFVDFIKNHFFKYYTKRLAEMTQDDVISIASAIEKTNLSQATKETYKRMLKRFVRFLGRNRKITKFHAGYQISNFYNDFI